MSACVTVLAKVRGYFVAGGRQPSSYYSYFVNIGQILYKIQKASLSLCGFPFRLGQSDFFSRIKMCPNLLGFALSNVPYRPSKVFHTNFVLVVPSEINKTIKACNFEM